MRRSLHSPTQAAPCTFTQHPTGTRCDDGSGTGGYTSGASASYTPKSPTHAAPTRLIHTKRLNRLKMMQQQGGAAPACDDFRQMRTSYERAGRSRVLIHPSVPFITGEEPMAPLPG